MEGDIVAIPQIPTSFWVQQGDGQVLCTWDNMAGATNYVVQRSDDGVNYTTVSTDSPNSFLDTTVTINTKYYYKVASSNSDGTSPYTAPATVIPTLVSQISLGELRLRAQQAADREGSTFVTMPEWNFYINQSVKELYDLLITCYEDYYIAPRLTFTTDGTSYRYPIPNGQNYDGAPALYKLYGVDCGLDTSQNAWVTLKKFDFIKRNKYVYPQITTTFLGVFNLQYRLLGDYIQFIPQPAGNQIIGLWYYPRINTLLEDTDVLDGISGWSEYVIIDAAIKALRKEESDTSVLMNEKLMITKRIEDSAQNRDVGQADTISDTRNWSSRWDYTGGPGGSGGGL